MWLWEQALGTGNGGFNKTGFWMLMIHNFVTHFPPAPSRCPSVLANLGKIMVFPLWKSNQKPVGFVFKGRFWNLVLISFKAQCCSWKLSAAWGKSGGDVLKLLCYVQFQSRILGLVWCSWTKICGKDRGKNELFFKGKKMQQTNTNVFPFHIMLKALDFVRAHRRNDPSVFQN